MASDSSTSALGADLFHHLVGEVPAERIDRVAGVHAQGQWPAERARLIGALIGLTDEQFKAETAPRPVDLPGRGQARAPGGAGLAQAHGRRSAGAAVQPGR